jgi:hypothetical protein
MDQTNPKYKKSISKLISNIDLLFYCLNFVAIGEEIVIKCLHIDVFPNGFYESQKI